MSKFRHLVDRVETLIGHGPVGPHEVIETDLNLSSSPNFEQVEEPVAPPAEEVPSEVPAPKSKKTAEPVNETPADPAPEVEA